MMADVNGRVTVFFVSVQHVKPSVFCLIGHPVQMLELTGGRVNALKLLYAWTALANSS